MTESLWSQPQDPQGPPASKPASENGLEKDASPPSNEASERASEFAPPGSSTEMPKADTDLADAPSPPQVPAPPPPEDSQPEKTPFDDMLANRDAFEKAPLDSLPLADNEDATKENINSSLPSTSNSVAAHPIGENGNIGDESLNKKEDVDSAESANTAEIINAATPNLSHSTEATSASEPERDSSTKPEAGLPDEETSGTETLNAGSSLSVELPSQVAIDSPPDEVKNGEPPTSGPAELASAMPSGVQTHSEEQRTPEARWVPEAQWTPETIEPSPSSSSGTGMPLLLEEWSEPIEVPLSAALLAAGTTVGCGDQLFAVKRHLKTEAGVNFYEVLSTPGSVANDGSGMTPSLTLRQASTAETRQVVAAEESLIKMVHSPLFEPMLQCWDDSQSYYSISGSDPNAPTLQTLLADDYSLYQVLNLLAQVASALAQMHAKGWVHLGLRPQSVTLGKPVKVGDLTYATRIGEKPSHPLFHSGYTAPEVASLENVDARADIYSLGALLYRVVNGSPLPETGAELLSWQPAHPIAGTPQILHRCLGSRDTRFNSMEELRAQLFRLKNRVAPMTTLSLAGATTIGLEPSRTTNQDAFSYLSGRIECESGPLPWAAWCVADGMGGMAAGEVASEVAARAVMSKAGEECPDAGDCSAEAQSEMTKGWLKTANREVCTAMKERGVRGGCTLICASVIGRRLAIAHVGDCRFYLIRQGVVRQLSRDHSLVMALVMQGEIQMNEIRSHPDRNKVMRSLGDRETLPDYYVDSLDVETGQVTLELQTDDVLLTCSDGLWEPVLEAEILSTLQNHPSLEAASQAILQIALSRGAPDNATAVFLRVDEYEIAATSSGKS